MEASAPLVVSLINFSSRAEILSKPFREINRCVDLRRSESSQLLVALDLKPLWCNTVAVLD